MQIIREDANEVDEVVKMEQVCLQYINDHIANVQKAYKKLFEGKVYYVDGIGEDEFKSYVESLREAIEHHDESKYTDEEFYGYRREYNPTEFEKKKMEEDESYKALVDEQYNEAWKHHYMNNDHHPKFWKVIDGVYSDDNPPKDMSLGAIIHMICDWEAVGMYYGTNTLDWYLNSATEEKNDMSIHTKAVLEELLRQIYGNF